MSGPIPRSDHTPSPCRYACGNRNVAARIQFPEGVWDQAAIREQIGRVPPSQVLTAEPTAETIWTLTRRRASASLQSPQTTINDHNTTEEPRLNNENEPRCIEGFLQHKLSKFATLQGVTTIVEHKIIMNDDRPFKLRYAIRNPAVQALINAEVNKLIATGQIESAKSPYNSLIYLAQRKNGTWRICMDFRHLNSKSIPDAYPLPKIHATLDRLRETRYISSLDLKSPRGYEQSVQSIYGASTKTFPVEGYVI
uniref:Reverse transcriptase domain-containing protein n=1 Tax=Glossina palpalis gambiensis TaxID=67801 RepID=A0A1B0C7P9_9MUSC